MMAQLFGQKRLPADPAQRGYHISYVDGQVNRCPGCGRSHWHIGRVSAECAFCGTALPRTEALVTGAGLIWRRNRTLQDFQAAA